jgi:hypothetical protein
MIETLRNLLCRSETRLLEDGIGLAALFVLLLVGLHLPVVF